MFVKIKFLLCKIVKCLIINLKKFLKDSTGPKKALEIMVLYASVTRSLLLDFFNLGESACHGLIDFKVLEIRMGFYI